MSITHAGEVFKGLRIPKSSPKGTKSHAVLIGTTAKPKVIRFGEKGAVTNKNAAQRKAFKARHAKNINKGETSAAYWANKVKW